MDGARRFTANGLRDTRMRVAESIYRDAAEKIEIFFAGRIENVGPASIAEHDRRALVGRQEKLFSVAERPRRSGDFLQGAVLARSARGPPSPVCFCFAHYAAESAAEAAGIASRSTRVPGISLRDTGGLDAGARTAASRPSFSVPPTMCTPPTPPSKARLAASSFSTMPPETILRSTRLPISSQATAERILSPQSTPETSVR